MLARRIPVLFLALVLALGSWVGAAPGARAATVSYSGRAYGAQVILVNPQPNVLLFSDTGELPSSGGTLSATLLTILLGSAFLLTQAVEYSHVGFNTSDGAFASVFFGLTGLHGAHVFIGLSLLTIAAVRAFKGHFTPEHHHGVEIPGIYWHFVDVMWIVVYFTVYIL